jgi:hypothetical protein
MQLRGFWRGNLPAKQLHGKYDKRKYFGAFGSGLSFQFLLTRSGKFFDAKIETHPSERKALKRNHPRARSPMSARGNTKRP